MKHIKYLVFLLVSFNAYGGKAQGVLSWGETARLSFPVTGVVQQVNTGSGSPVKQGAMLAQLDLQPFKIKLKKCAARLESIQPGLFDARLEVDQAEELYERTVLSEVEFQKIEGTYKKLVAEEEMIKADHELARWKLKNAQLIAPFQGRVVSQQVVRGQVVSTENQGEIYIEVAKVGSMAVALLLDINEIKSISLHKKIMVKIAGRQYQGKISSIAMQADSAGKYRVQASFNHNPENIYYAGQPAEVNY